MSAIQEILDKVNNKVKDLTVLEIKTLMGELELVNGKIEFKPNQDIQGITSHIDLVDGDITTRITEEFYNKYPELVQWHQSREAKGNEIIENNIKTVGTLVSEIKEFIKNGQQA
jgi:hypothetical protein